MQEKNIYICATMDTKGEEAMYLKQQIEACGNRAYIIDIALRATPKQYSVDYTLIGGNIISIHNIFCSVCLFCSKKVSLYDRNFMQSPIFCSKYRNSLIYAPIK